MLTVQDILNQIELIAPARWAFGFDNVGLLFGKAKSEVTKVVVCLDPSPDAVTFAKEVGAQAIITHHPVFFMGVKSITDRDNDGAFILGCAEAGIAHIAVHTNWDAAPGGINDTLAAKLGLTNISTFGSGADVSYHKIVVYTPTDYTSIVLDALAAAGAGNVGLYRRCAFKSRGTGTYEPLPGAEPFAGRVGKTEEVEEDRLEVICPAHKVNQALAAILEKHPYEEPAYDVLVMRPLVEQACGRIGVLPEAMSMAKLIKYVENALGYPALGWGTPEKLISKVALVGGAADSDWDAARKAGADVYITGEIKHYVALEAATKGMCMIAAGHFATENPGMIQMRETLSQRLPGIEWLSFEPSIGSAARPLV
jgi:dinuclear metal center YbgI/SA1388 family protein